MAARLLDVLVFSPLWVPRLFGIDHVALLVLAWVINPIYDIGLTARYGQTLGKRWLGLRIVEADGSIPSIRAATIRWAVPTVPGLIGLWPPLWFVNLIVFAVVYLPMRHRPLHQGLHDKAAGTVVTACRT